jgi:undecaprenyl-diphosphatase
LITEVFRAAVLGALQGATEFLPVSSSGHLVLVPAWLGWELPSLAFTAMIHMATAFSALAYFRSDWIALATNREQGHRTLVLLAVASVPAVLVGVLFEAAIEAMFQSPRATAAQLWLTALILLLAEWLGRRRAGGSAPLNAPKALTVGLGQAAAIIPGISRSASTISVAMMVGLDRPDAARFSFLMVPPILLGAGLYELMALTAEGPGEGSWAAIVVGSVSAFVVGYASIHWFMDWVRRRSLIPFAAYTAVVATAGYVTFS